MNSTELEAKEMEEMMSDPRFQNLFGKAESHQWKFRLKESALLDSTGELLPMRTAQTLRYAVQLPASNAGSKTKALDADNVGGFIR